MQKKLVSYFIVVIVPKQSLCQPLFMYSRKCILCTCSSILLVQMQQCLCKKIKKKLKNKKQKKTGKSMFAISGCYKATSALVIYTLCNMKYCVFSLIVISSNQQLLVVTCSYQQLLVVACSYQYQLLVVTVVTGYASGQCQLLVVTCSYWQLLVVKGSWQQLLVVVSSYWQ